MSSFQDRTKANKGVGMKKDHSETPCLSLQPNLIIVEVISSNEVALFVFPYLLWSHNKYSETCREEALILL